MKLKHVFLSVFVLVLSATPSFCLESYNLQEAPNTSSSYYRNKLFYISSQNNLFKYNLFGNKEWQVPIKKAANCQLFLNQIFLLEASELASYSADYGLKLWSFEKESVVSYALGYPYVFALTVSGSIFAVDFETGVIIWESGKQTFEHMTYVHKYQEILAQTKQGKYFRLSPLTGHVSMLKEYTHLSGPGTLLKLGDWLFYDGKGHWMGVTKPVLNSLTLQRPYIFLEDVHYFFAWMKKETFDSDIWTVIDHRLIKKNTDNTVFIYDQHNYSFLHAVHLEGDNSKILSYNELPHLKSLVTEKYGYNMEIK